MTTKAQKIEQRAEQVRQIRAENTPKEVAFWKAEAKRLGDLVTDLQGDVDRLQKENDKLYVKVIAQ
jgi:hypothetical protein